MPNRIIRDGFVDSEAVNALTDWTHRVYSNLLVKCDDAGRFDGRIEYIRSHLFPLGTDRRLGDVEKAIEEMEQLGLLLRYEYKGKPFLQVTKWQKCGKTLKSRYPWKDGSFNIHFVTLDTRDGEKDFVATSILDGVATGSTPHTHGVPPKTNTETETDTDTLSESDDDGSASIVLQRTPDGHIIGGSRRTPEQESRDRASADARCWVNAERPDWIRGIPLVAQLFHAVGKDHAIRALESVEARKGGFPPAYLAEVLKSSGKEGVLRCIRGSPPSKATVPTTPQHRKVKI